MIIARIEPILYNAGRRGIWCLVRVETDEGVTGIGESSTTDSVMAAAVIKRLAEWMVGRDPSRIQELWQDAYHRYYNVRGGNLLLCALSGIEQALWDIKGKMVGLPVYALLGGAVRDRIPAYVNHMFFGDDLPYDPAAWAERAVAAVDRGFKAIKIDPYGSLQDYASPQQLRRATAIAYAVRAAIGPDIELAVDTHARFALATAIRAGRALEDLDLLFLEEPAPPENVGALRRVREALRTPLASGERIYTKWGFQTLLDAQVVEVIQPDVAHCGGIFEARLIAAQAESHYLQIAPHNWYGPVALAASLQLDACTPNVLIQERPLPYIETPAEQNLLTEPPRMIDGALVVPDGPGLGVTLDEAVLDAHRVRDL